jgi:hypothetical protein
MAIRGTRRVLLATIGLAVLVSGARAGGADTIRRPRGIYAVVAETRANKAADFDALLSNPAVSGLAIRTFWSTLQPEKTRYDFSSLDAAFAAAGARHKTVQLILVPGFGTPSWVLDELPSCDDVPLAAGEPARGRRGGRAQSGRAEPAQSTRTETAHAPCGKATFEVSEGRGSGQKQALPLPWNPVYKNYWKAFLTQVAARFGSNETFVSIAIAGPTAESVEIILPRSGDQLDRWAALLEISYRDASYHRSDKAFVEEWGAAVNMFGEVFRNVTLVVTRGSGLLNFTHGQNEAAQAEIMSAFAHHGAGPNAKATQTSGLKACRDTVAGIKGVKEMSTDSSLSPRVLGGAQFDTSFSQKPANEGCAASCDAAAPACRSITPRQALPNVLAVYFEGTPAGDLFGSSKGPAQMNYLQIYAPDITFAATEPAVQALLEQASQRLLAQAR